VFFFFFLMKSTNSYKLKNIKIKALHIISDGPNIE